MSQYIHCQKEKEELIKAMEEWIYAVHQASASREPQLIEETEQMMQAYNLEEKAEKKFRDALKTHDDCIDTWFDRSVEIYSSW